MFTKIVKKSSTAGMAIYTNFEEYQNLESNNTIIAEK